MAAHYQTEAEVCAVLPDRAAPRLWWSLDVDRWLLLAFDDIRGREPDLSPGSRDVPAVLEALRNLSEVLTPCPWPAAATASEELAGEFRAWNELTATPREGISEWARQHATALAGIERLFLEHTEGDTLLHTDLRADNMLIDDAGEVRVIDWSWVVRGAGWLDLAFLVPQLILAGHTPRAAEKTLSCLPAWQQAPADALTSFAAAVTGVWERGRLAEGPDHLLAYRQRAVQAGAAWLEHRLRS
ncbi:hypothetical protein GCM10009533_59760 [Saccharopolyspora spinosporotrichia]|uniref:Aminoglycoside phosphotransferase domain-containing protein n=2 Tax=Saccharopolyspora erythraea TaxID=1836 RepID=A0ABP3P0I2_SACER